MDYETPIQDINEEDHEYRAMHRQLANSKKVLIIKSLHRRGTATASHLRAELSIKQPTASKYLGALVAAKFLSRVKVGTSVWYKVNSETETWKDLARWEAASRHRVSGQGYPCHASAGDLQKGVWETIFKSGFKWHPSQKFKKNLQFKSLALEQRLRRPAFHHVLT